MRVTDFLETEVVIPDIRATDKTGALQELVQRLAEHYQVGDAERLLEVIQAREQVCSTAVGEGVAIPHGKVRGAKRVVGAFARSLKGIDFDAQDGQPTHLFFLLVAPEDSTSEHLNALARVSRLIKDRALREKLMQAGSAKEIMQVIRERDTHL